MEEHLKLNVGPVGSLIIIAVLIVVSALFSGSETALTGASGARMHGLEKEGDKRAALVNKLRERKEDMISALLLGSTLVNIFCSALATSMAIRYFGSAGIVYATLGVTVALLIMAEVLPKTIALNYADRVAMAVAPVVLVILFMFGPVVRIVASLVGGLLSILRLTSKGEEAPEHNKEVLKGAIELHHGPEEETQEQRAMLRSIMDLAEVSVGEVMTHRKNITMIDGNLSIVKVLDEVLKSPHTRIPVWQERPDNIVGVIHTKALLKELQLRSGQVERVKLGSLLSEPWFIPDSTSLYDQLQAFRERREHFALVVDEYGSLMGVVTLEDILEEIVGEIEDETDQIVAGVRKQPNGSYLMNGTLTIRDLNREYDWSLPDDKAYSTLAGLILHEAQMIPDVGQVFQFYGFTFEVVRRQRNQITLVRVTPPKASDANN